MLLAEIEPSIHKYFTTCFKKNSFKWEKLIQKESWVNNFTKIFIQETPCLHKDNSLISDSLKKRKLEEKLITYRWKISFGS